MQQWFVAACKTNQEDRAQENLGRQCYEVFCPVLRSEVLKNGEKAIKSALLFPGYIFVKFDPELQASSTVNHSMGVKKLVTFGDVLVPVNAKIIDGIKFRLDGFVAKIPEKLPLVSGSKVKINGSCFEGADAIFDEPVGANRSMLLINILGSQQRVMVDNRYIA